MEYHKIDRFDRTCWAQQRSHNPRNSTTNPTSRRLSEFHPIHECTITQQAYGNMWFTGLPWRPGPPAQAVEAADRIQRVAPSRPPSPSEEQRPRWKGWCRSNGWQVNPYQTYRKQSHGGRRADGAPPRCDQTRTFTSFIGFNHLPTNSSTPGGEKGNNLHHLLGRISWLSGH